MTLGHGDKPVGERSNFTAVESDDYFVNVDMYGFLGK
jgi:hypothetical protein